MVFVLDKLKTMIFEQNERANWYSKSSVVLIKSKKYLGGAGQDQTNSTMISLND